MNHPTRYRPPILLMLLLAASLALPAVGCRRKGGEAFNKGQAHLKKKRYAKAITSFRKAVKQNPDFGEAHYNLGAARFQLAAIQLNGLVKQHGSQALKAALKATAVNAKAAGPLSPERNHSQTVLLQELGRLPETQAAAIVTLLRKALSSKLKARKLFQKGKFVVIRKSSTRRSMLGSLDRVAQLRALLQKRGENNQAMWLLAVARPVLLTERTTAKSRPRPSGVKKP